MAKCVKCQKRKSKRFCIALGQSICSLCCGLLREKEIHCPSHCTYLVQHKPYQQDKFIEKKQKQAAARSFPEEDILRDERLAWLAFQVEMTIKALADKTKSIQDKDALLALEYAKDKLEKGKGILLLIDQKPGPQNELGEAIYRTIQDCRYEKKIILPDEQMAYTLEEKIKCADRLILAIQSFVQGNFEGRNYLAKLDERFSRLKKISDQKKILTQT